VYAQVLQDLKSVVKENTTSGQPTTQGRQPEETEFREQRRRKRNPSEEEAKKPKTMPNAGIKDPWLRPHHDVPTKNFFAPLRATNMECEGNKSKDTDTQDEVQQEPASKTGRPPPIVLTLQENLIAMQTKLKGLCKGSFEFRSTRNLENQNLPYFTFFLKSEKPIKAVIRHLPINTPAEDISDGLVDVGFDVITVKQMTTTRRSTTGQSTVNLPLFLITLPRTPKSQEIFKLTSLCYIAVKVEAYKAQTGLTQCYNCQQFGHVWANCKQPPRCLWCGMQHQNRHAAIASWGKERNNTPPTTVVAAMPGRSCRRRSRREHPNLQRVGCSPPDSQLLVCLSLRRSALTRSTNRLPITFRRPPAPGLLKWALWLRLW
jgi:hypothetical protein